MRIQTAIISTKELQDALRIYCSDKAGIPDTVIIKSGTKHILVSLDPDGRVSADEFTHDATGA